MSDAVRPQLTIVVPTYNRYPLLDRLLRYYQACGAPFPLHVLDSSSDGLSEGVRRGTEGMPQVTYRRYDSTMRPTVKLADGLRQVTTPYAVLWADDDLMVPRAFDTAVRILETRGDVSVAHGRSGLFQLAREQGRGAVHTAPYAQTAYLDDTAGLRVAHYFHDCTTIFYSVHRTENLADNLARCLAFGFGESASSPQRSDWWVERLLACLSLTQGKAWQFDELYMMRDRHAGTDSWEAGGDRLDLFDWVAGPTFSAGFSEFSRCLSEAIARRDGIDIGRAHAIIKDGFWDHLGASLARQWRARHDAPPAQAGLRRQLRRVPGLRRAWRRMRAVMPHSAFSLESLRRPDSIFHRDFAPMYRAMLDRPQETAEPLVPAIR